MGATALERYLGAEHSGSGLVDIVIDSAMAEGATRRTGSATVSQERHKSHLAKLLGIGNQSPGIPILNHNHSNNSMT